MTMFIYFLPWHTRVENRYPMKLWEVDDVLNDTYLPAYTGWEVLHDQSVLCPCWRAIPRLREARVRITQKCQHATHLSCLTGSIMRFQDERQKRDEYTSRDESGPWINFRNIRWKFRIYPHIPYFQKIDIWAVHSIGCRFEMSLVKQKFGNPD